MPLMPSSPRERKLLIVLGVVVLLIGGFLVFRAVTGGGETEAAGPDTGAPTAPATTAPSPAPSPTETLTFSGRDPFKPLIAPASTSSSGESTAPPTTYTPPAGGSSTPPPTTPPPTPTPTSTGSTPPPSTECPGQSVTINEHHVTICDIWTMDGTDWVKIYLKNDGDDGAFLDVYEGQTFEYVFKVVSIDDPCASFLHGETPFTLCLTSS